MNEMRRLIISTILTLVVLVGVFAAEDTRALTVSTVVPVDYGVVFPADGLRLDRLYLALEAAGGDRNYLTTEDTTIHTGLITDHPDGMVFHFLFYGNLATTYQVMITADAGSGLVLQSGDDTFTIPVDVSFQEPEEENDNVVLEILDGNTAMLQVDTVGAVSALDVLELRVKWEDSPEIIAGDYMADLSLELTTM